MSSPLPLLEDGRRLFPTQFVSLAAVVSFALVFATSCAGCPPKPVHHGEWENHRRGPCKGMGTRRDTASVGHASSVEEALATCRSLPLEIDEVAVQSRECTTESGKVIGTFDVSDSSCREIMLDVPLRAQKTVEWCWAASAEMAMASLGKQVEQCQQATDKVRDAGYEDEDCCASVAKCPDAGTQPPCVQARWPNFDAYGFHAEPTDHRALEWEELVEEMVEGRPVLFTWSSAGKGHMMVARGVRTELDGSRWVSVNDPEKVCEGHQTLIRYEDYVEGPDHTHWNDYRYLRRLPSTGSNVAALRSKRVEPIRLAQVRPLVPAVRGPASPMPRAEAAAQAAVEALGQAAWAELGLGPTVKPNQIAYGPALPDALIWQRDLSQYNRGDDPMKLVKATGLYFVPMKVDGVITSGLMVRKQGNTFFTIRVGDIPLAKKVGRRTQSPPPGATDFGLVRVPFLHAALLIAHGPNASFLMFLDKDARVILPPYQWLAAKDAMAELARLARIIVPGDL